MDFLEKHKKNLFGSLCGFDRMIIKGMYQKLYYGESMYAYMKNNKIMLFDLEDHIKSERLKLHAHLEQLAKENDAAFVYANNSSIKKGKIAEKYLETHPTKQGLIAVIRCLEVSSSFSLRYSHSTKEKEIKMEQRKHLHYYLYIVDEEFGWMHIRIQGWLPYEVQVYVNGREYLKRALDKEGITYEAHENSLTRVADLNRAQELADQLVNKRWYRFLNVLARYASPFISHMESSIGATYRWFVKQVEVATDVMFKKVETLEELYPDLVQHAILFRGGEDIFTFFGRKIHHLSKKEVKGNMKKYDQGFRVKHYLDRNSIKMYPKGSVLRIETTINNPGGYKIYKDAIREGKRTKAWGPMGKAVTNLYRYVQVAQAGNIKYLNALSVIDQPSYELIKQVEKISKRRRVRKKGRKDRYYSAFNLLTSQTHLILEAINDGKFCIKSFTNKDIREALIGKEGFLANLENPKGLKRLSGKITRLFAKLRAHKIIRKISRTSSYTLTKLGQIICNQLLFFKGVQLKDA